MKNRPTNLWILWCLCPLIFCANLAAAQDAGRTPLLQELLDRAHDAYQNNEFDKAVALLDRAYQIEALPELLINRGRALEAKGDCLAARESYDRALSQAGEHQAAARDARAALPCADTSPITPPQQVLVAPPQDPVVPPSQAAAPVEVLDPAGESWHWPSVTILGGVGILVSAVALDVYAQGVYEEADMVGRAGLDRPRFESLRGDFETLSGVTVGLYGLGSALVVGGVLWWWLGEDEPTDQGFGLSFGTQGAAASWTLGF